MIERAKLKGYGAFALVFLLGLLAGGALSRALLQRHYGRMFKDPSAVFERRRLGALARRLNLDDAQENRVRDIMDKYAAQRRGLTRDIMDRCGAPLRTQKAELDAEIRAVLRPDQQARYDTLLKDREARPPPGAALEPLP
jgi:Spy/CpxP family protein refolding chaperone